MLLRVEVWLDIVLDRESEKGMGRARLTAVTSFVLGRRAFRAQGRLESSRSQLGLVLHNSTVSTSTSSR